MKLATIAIAALCAGSAWAQEAGAFGYIERVVLEPDANAPERIQLWGTFSVAAREEGAYQVPEDGYLYFKLPEQGVEQARAEWRKLADWPKAGGPEPKIAAISGRRVGLRVRTGDERASAPDPYEAGYSLDRAGEGARLLGAMPKGGVRHYAVVDRVEAEPSTGSPKEVRIWGTFSIEAGPPERGYIHFAIDEAQKWAVALEQWQSMAGTGRPVAFYTRGGAGTLVVRAVNEARGAPDLAMVLNMVLPVGPDTRYLPVRRLLGSKCAFTQCY